MTTLTVKEFIEIIYKWNITYSYMAINNTYNKISDMIHQLKSKILSTFLIINDTQSIQGEMMKVMQKSINKSEDIMNEKIFMGLFEKIIEYLIANVIDNRDDTQIRRINELYKIIQKDVEDINKMIISMTFYSFSVKRDAKKNFDIKCESEKELFGDHKKEFKKRMEEVIPFNELIMNILDLYDEYVLNCMNDVKKTIMYVQYDPKIEAEKFWNQFFTYKGVDYRNYSASFKRDRNNLIKKILEVYNNKPQYISEDIMKYYTENENGNSILLNNYNDAMRQVDDTDDLSVMEFIRNVVIYNFQYEQYYDTINQIIEDMLKQDIILYGGKLSIMQRKIMIINKIMEPKIKFIEKVNEIIKVDENAYIANYAEPLMDIVKYESDYNVIYRWIAILDKMVIILGRLKYIVNEPIKKNDYIKRIIEALKDKDNVVELMEGVNTDIMKDIGDIKIKESEIDLKEKKIEHIRVEIDKLEKEIAKNEGDINTKKALVPSNVNVDLNEMGDIEGNILKTAAKIKEPGTGYYSAPNVVAPKYANLKLNNVESIVRNVKSFSDIDINFGDLINKYNYIKNTNLIAMLNKRIVDNTAKISDLEKESAALIRDVEVEKIKLAKI